MFKQNLFKVSCSNTMKAVVSNSKFIKKWDRGRTRRIVPIYVFLLALTVFFLSSSSSWAVIYISNIVDLQKIGNDPGYPLNGEYELTQDIDASDTVNWNNGAGFLPIGTESNPFTGKFDGKGHKIIGLYINRDSTDYAGLFGYIDSGSEVNNVGIENGQIVGRDYVGSLVGWNEGTVSNCYSTGSVTGSSNVGGLVGNNYNSTVRDSYSMCSVTGSVDYIGGLIGNLNGFNVINTYSTGAVGGNGSNKGGLIGYVNTGELMSSYWDTDTSGMDTSAAGTGKTTTEMKQKSTFSGWNFTTVWDINEGVSYPYLLWQGRPLVTIPNVVGKTQADAESEITRAGLTVGTVSEKCSDTIDAGNVISQNPAGGGQIPLGNSVELVVSTGPCPEGTPEGEGITEGEGTTEGIPEGSLEGTQEGEGINEGEGIIEGTLEGTPEGTAEGEGTIEGTTEGVLEGTQEGEGITEGEGTSEGTPEGTQEGTPEGIVEGEVNVSVPNVVGMTQSNASSAITGAGLTVGTVIQHCNNTVPAGSVISQNPAGGEQVSPGTAVNLVISTGPCPVSVPDVVGMTQSNASSAITGAGLTVGTVSQQCNDTVEAGKVISQTPSAGQQVSPGTAVNIVVSTGPCPVSVPNVVGMTQSNASSAITGAGLTVGTVSQQCSNTVEAGKVISQDPSSGQQVSPGTAVNLVISTGPCPTIQINNIEELQKIGNDPEYPLNWNYELKKDISASDTINWNSGDGFIPIGSENNPFTGIFDGKGHKIMELYINRPFKNYVGLFGYIGLGGEVRNLGVENAMVIGTNNIGCLIGMNKEGSVSKCYSTGSVVGSSNVGGLVGNSYSSKVRDSYSMCSVTGSVNNIGGLIGYLYGGSIIYTYSTGTVSSSGSAGGLVGYAEGPHNVLSSYWDKETSGVSTSAVGISKTTAQMKQQATFVGWDFRNTWGILENTTYPRFLWEYVVPNLIGMTQANASSAITGAGLTVGTVSQQCSDTVPAGSVISQTPSAGQQVSPGTAVNIVVSTGPCPISVPNVVGMTQSNASSAITGAGLTVGTVSQQCSDTVPAGSVISQTPSAGQQVSPGTAVNIVVSTGPCPISVPNVVGMTQSNALSAITGAGLTVGTVSQQCNDTVEAGKVISQDPTAGQQVSPGTAVNIVVSTGPCPVSVPNVVGMTQSNASSAITGAGLTVGTVSQQCSDTVEAGKVISQTPSAGQQVSPGTAVNIVVSTGPCPVSVPNVVGMTQANASSAITGAGLMVGTVSQQCSNTVEAGKVISQTPSAGQQVTPGTAVNIVVSTGPCPVSVPNVVGMSYATEAVNTITGIGLTVGTVSQLCSDTVPAGKVISQDPVAGQQVPRGTAVNLVVSTGPCPVPVPNVVGMTQAEASRAITEARLNVGTLRQLCSDTVPAGKIISQDPVGGQQVSPGTAVNLVVSTGPCPVPVPNVVGMTQSNATSAITGAGLTVGTVSQQCSNTVEAGKVISQDPVGGQQVLPGTAVNLVISTGPCPVIVPNVVGMRQVDAETTITGVGLTVGTIIEQYSNTVEKGKVISQDPTAGQQVSQETQVSLVISKGPVPIPIDNIEELQKIGNNVEYPLNWNYELSQDIDASDTKNWNNGTGFAPIGLENSPFTGTFDGKGYKIRGLYINRSGKDNIGLFGYIGSGSEIKDLGLEDCTIVGDWYVGGLVGKNYYGTVSNCHTVVSVSGGGDYVGGLIGYNYFGTVLKCYSTSSVKGNTSVGGLLGKNWNGMVSDCYSKSSVSDSGDNVGGLIGENNKGTVSSCYSTGSVKGSYNVGGFVGYNCINGKISNCFSIGSVSGNKYIGGLVGYNDNSGTVSYCYSKGSVLGMYNVGGLVGHNKGGTISSSYWDVQTSKQSSSDGGTGKTTVEMKQQLTYIGWDFTNVWGIEEGVSYPYLLWQGGPIIPEGEGSAHEGATEGTQEGTAEGSAHEGATEGTHEGTAEGSAHEGTHEGATEGSIREGIIEGTKEGEGDGDGGGTDKGCGCFGGKSLGEVWWKYLVDFVLFGLVISLMSGMGRSKSGKDRVI